MNFEVIDVKCDQPKFSFKMELDKDRPLQNLIRDINSRGPGNYYEYTTTMFLASRWTAGDQFIDVGAHAGWFTLLAQSMGLHTDSFEPEEWSYFRLLRNLKLNGCKQRARPHHLAVGYEAGPVDIHICPENDGANALWKDQQAHTDQQLAWMTPLAPYIKDPLGFSYKTWIKLDCEGAEFQIVSQIQHLFMSPHKGKYGLPTFVVEINRPALHELGAFEMELRNRFYALGYRSYVFDRRDMVEMKQDSQVLDQDVFNMYFIPEGQQ